MLLYNGNIVTENQITKGSILIKEGVIKEIFYGEIPPVIQSNERIIDVSGKYIFPGIIDDQVHFREPGLTYKADIYTESKAAVAGGITSYLEMPNTIPQSTTLSNLEEKYKIASNKSLANYGFYFGATNTNIKDILGIDPKYVPGLKVFMGASTGNMLVDNIETLNDIFKNSPVLIATHCEDENTIQTNLKHYTDKYGDDIPIKYHPAIRSHDACIKSSSLAMQLAKKYNSRLHILHLSTAQEVDLFDNTTPLEEKRITSEVCVHHLWFDDSFYNSKGTLIKWNPAIKSIHDRDALRQALLNNFIDVIATDHAPHTIEEKKNVYTKAPSGGPLVQHSLVTMLELYHKNEISLEKIAEKMCHNPAIIFNISNRGYIKKGYAADIVVVDLNKKWTVSKDNILYKCNWSPFEGTTFNSSILYTVINGNLVYDNGIFNESIKGEALLYNR